MKPNWQNITIVKVESGPGIWQIAEEYIPGSRMLRFKVLNVDAAKNSVPTVWNPLNGTGCGADGVYSAPSKANLLCSAAMYGALIGKLGGSSADLPDSSSPLTPYGSKRVFTVGTHCIISLSSTDGGPLYLTMNDSPESFSHHSGALHVQIDEYAT
jgi:hypothetical protein